jgi:transcription elongation GreA/GreB family factor
MCLFLTRTLTERPPNNQPYDLTELAHFGKRSSHAKDDAAKPASSRPDITERQIRTLLERAQ